MQTLADRSPDHNAHRADEPYRRALTGVYARLAATLKDLTGTEAARHAVAPGLTGWAAVHQDYAACAASWKTISA